MAKKSMKQTAMLGTLALATGLLMTQGACAGFAFMRHGTPMGSLYTDASSNEAVVAAKGGGKTGQGCAVSYLGIVTTGDASVASAAKAGGITTVATVDHHFKNIIGLFSEYCVIVTGE